MTTADVCGRLWLTISLILARAESFWASEINRSPPFTLAVWETTLLLPNTWAFPLLASYSAKVPVHEGLSRRKGQLHPLLSYHSLRGMSQGVIDPRHRQYQEQNKQQGSHKLWFNCFPPEDPTPKTPGPASTGHCKSYRRNGCRGRGRGRRPHRPHRSVPLTVGRL